MRVKELHPLVQEAISGAIRTAISLPMIAGPGASLFVAQGVGRWLAQSAGRKRFRRALSHIAIAYPHLSPRDHHEIALRSFEHLALLAVELCLTPRVLTDDRWVEHIDFSRTLRGFDCLSRREPTIMITAHCGNWEVLGYAMAMLGFPVHALYRPLDLKPIDRWVRRTRARRGMYLIDKFGAMNALPALMARREPIGFVADQNAGERGVFVPFFGRLASTYKSVALLAVQYRATVVCGQARRLRPQNLPPLIRGPITRRARTFLFSAEVEDVIHPDQYMAHPNPVFYLSARYRHAIERMVGRAPGDYFWMHRSWRARPRHERDNKPFPGHLRDLLHTLEWLTPADVEGIVERSDRDRATLVEIGDTRLP